MQVRTIDARYLVEVDSQINPPRLLEGPSVACFGLIDRCVEGEALCKQATPYRSVC